MSAPTPVLRTLVDSPNTVKRLVTIPSGGDADVTATKVVDISAFTTGVTGTDILITRVEWSLEGFSVLLHFDADTDVHALTLASGTGSIDLSGLSKGGLSNNAGTGKTGDLMMTTSGLGATTENGYFIVEVTKVV